LEVRRLKDHAKGEVIKAISQGLVMTMEDLQSIIVRAQPNKPDYDPNLPVLDVLVASVIGNCIKHGDMARFSLLINYVMGKPKPLGSSWHDDLPSEDGKDPTAAAQTALKAIPSSVLIEALRKQNAGTGPEPAG
jgi:hypothetical protein